MTRQEHIIGRLKKINHLRNQIMQGLAPEVNRMVLEALEMETSKKIARLRV